MTKYLIDHTDSSRQKLAAIYILRGEECWSYIDTLVSGSPIIQNGKLFGAITHVLVNDPTKGYAIFIENMLETEDKVSKAQMLKDVS